MVIVEDLHQDQPGTDKLRKLEAYYLGTYNYSNGIDVTSVEGMITDSKQ